MSIYVNKNVFWLDVSVDYIHVVEVFETKQKLRKIESGLIFRELLDLTKVEKHLTTRTEVHNEKQLSF